jgi:UDP-N-acetylmuramate dehydrogenase
MTFSESLARRFGAARAHHNAPLAALTTFKVGGPAEWLLETTSEEELLAALRIAHEFAQPVTLLGGGSNVLIADAGIRGLVIRPRAGEVRRLDSTHIRADAAMTINGLVRWSINHGVAGLEAWAGTPGTVGGAIFGNAHYAGRLIGDRVASVRLAGHDGVPYDRQSVEMEFGYDRSRLQRTGEVLVSAVFVVSAADPGALREIARQSLAHRKRTQPLESPSAGCIFQNPDASVVPAGVPASAGALVDRAGLKGIAVGGARVSATHANFIVNEGGATAADIRRLIDLCRDRVRERFGVTLKEEIVLLGDSQDVQPAD